MELKEAFKNLYQDAKEKYNIQQAPKLILRKDEKNADMIFGRTAYYDPENLTIVVFITNRHPKDILRSYCHEIIHHVQNERGDLDMGDASSPTYAQDDEHMRKMEMEAYLKGNLLLRDFEDNFKYQ
jgi:Zn-dependent peptidase ImmA (M78 family)